MDSILLWYYSWWISYMTVFGRSFFPRNTDGMFLRYIPQKGISVVSLQATLSQCMEFGEVLVVHSCPTLCDPMDCSLPGSSIHGIPGKNTGVGGHSLLQGIFPTQGLSPGLRHCKRILYHWAGVWVSGFFLPCSIGSGTGPAALGIVVRVRNQILVPPNGVAQIPPGCLPCETTKPWPPHYRTQRNVLMGRNKGLRTQGRTLYVSPSLRIAPTHPDKMPPPSGNSQQGKIFVCASFKKPGSQKSVA